MTTTVFTTKTVTGKDKEPKHRERLRVHIKPRPHDTSEYDTSEHETSEHETSDHEAAELDDLSNDQYFYDQLEKNKPTTESSEEIEHVHVHDRPRHNPNHDVVFYHGSRKGNKKEKHRQKLANIQDQPVNKDEDTFDDYGEMVMPDKDVEMHDTFEKNTKESYVHGPVHKKRRRPICSDHNPTSEMGNILHTTNSHSLPYHNHKTVYEPVRKRKFERIMVTKKLSSPDELHAEIDKIFQMKNKHYNKRGHDKSHWELRIVPQHYDESHTF